MQQKDSKITEKNKQAPRLWLLIAFDIVISNATISLHLNQCVIGYVKYIDECNLL